MTNDLVRQECLEGLLEALRQLPQLEVEERPRVPGDPGAPDLRLRLRGKGQSTLVAVDFRHRGYPRDVREAARQLRAKKRRALPMVAAPSISPGARELLRSEGVAYWDSGGSLFLDLPWGIYLVDRPAPPATPSEGRTPRNLYRGKTAQVLHALLGEPGRTWKVRDLAEASRVSAYTAHQVLAFLEDQLWVERRGKGPKGVRTLRHPGKLLDTWAAEHTLSEYTVHRFHQLAPDAAALEAGLFGFLEHLKVDWALTLEHGADRSAPLLTHLPATMAVLVLQNMPWEKLARAAGFRPVDEGANVLLLAVADAGPLMGRQRQEDAWIASPIQLYLDLMASPRRGKEQAAHLRFQRLDF